MKNIIKIHLFVVLFFMFFVSYAQAKEWKIIPFQSVGTVKLGVEMEKV